MAFKALKRADIPWFESIAPSQTTKYYIKTIAYQILARIPRAFLMG